MDFTVFTKDNIDKNSKSNEATKHFHGPSICAFQTMKSVDDGIARRSRMIWCAQLMTFPYPSLT